jgi:hypothetical protein
MAGLPSAKACGEALNDQSFVEELIDGSVTVEPPALH